MINKLPNSLSELIDLFSKFPGIGKKTAHRLGLHVLHADSSFVTSLSNALINIKEKINACNSCNNFSESELCNICEDKSRDETIICICEDASDIVRFENTGYNGQYHVIESLISPVDGIGPETINLEKILIRLKKVKEVIIAIDSSINGDATTLFLANELSALNLKVTRLARGIPIGSNLDFIDDATLTKSIDDRIEI